MSGHSKFANIKHKKEKNDAKKGKIFTVIGRELVMAVKAGGPDPNNNSKLRDVIAKAKANNMPNDTIERGIKKASLLLSDFPYPRSIFTQIFHPILIVHQTIFHVLSRFQCQIHNYTVLCEYL